MTIEGNVICRGRGESGQLGLGGPENIYVYKYVYICIRVYIYIVICMCVYILGPKCVVV